MSSAPHPHRTHWAPHPTAGARTSHRRRWMVTLIPVWVWPTAIRVPRAWLHDACDEPARTYAPLRPFEYTRKLESPCITCHKVRGQPVGSGGRAVDVPARRSQSLRRRADKRCTEAADKCRRSHCTTAPHALRFLAPDHGSMLLKWWAPPHSIMPIALWSRGARHEHAPRAGGGCRPCRWKYGRR